MRIEKSGEHQPLYLRMLTLSGLPKIVSCLFGKVLPGRPKTCQLKSISKIGRNGGAPIEYGGQLPPRIAEVAS